jgi:hypothetical protein
VNLFEIVKTDLDARNELGMRVYKKPMQPHDGRNSLQDAYEEALDLVMYLKKALVEQERQMRAVDLSASDL